MVIACSQSALLWLLMIFEKKDPQELSGYKNVYIRAQRRFISSIPLSQNKLIKLRDQHWKFFWMLLVV